MAGTILVVDDEPHILQVVSLKLRNAGFTVLTAADGEEGAMVARESSLDLVITDYQMPYKTGIELSRMLRSNPSTADVPVIILTARGYSLSENDLSEGNIRGMISKPFSPRALLQTVNDILGDGSNATTPASVNPKEAA